MAPGRAYPRVVVIGVGNLERRDDGAGIMVARAVHERVRDAGLAGVDVCERSGEVAQLLDTWSPAEAAVIVDAAHAGAGAGTVHRVDVTSGGAGEPLLASLMRCSSHGLGVAEAIELGRALGRLPEHRVVVYGIEGQEFGHGAGVSAAVAAGIAEAVERILADIAALRKELGNA